MISRLKEWNKRIGKEDPKLALFAAIICIYRKFESIYQVLEQTRNLSNPYVQMKILKEWIMFLYTNLNNRKKNLIYNSKKNYEIPKNKTKKSR